jgi:hypothetical protein
MHTPLDTLESLYIETIQEGVEVLLEIVKSISIIPKEKTHVHAK